MTKISTGSAQGSAYAAALDHTGGVNDQPSTDTPRRVLVVEDERTLAGMVAAYLSQAGFTAEIAYRGDDAVVAVRADPPDVVVLDLGLPGMDGVEVCRQIRTFSDCYIIITTARKEEVDTLIGLRVGTDDYRSKT